MIKIATVIGARPQFVKSAVLSRLWLETANINEFVIHTGQHFDRSMSDVFFEEMKIPRPYVNLGITGTSHAAMTANMILSLEKTFLELKPDILLTYGDTNSTFAGALTASKLGIPVAHVEAGLRSYNMDMPEEINRVVTDSISKWLFCPTENAVEILKKENHDKRNAQIIKSGDIMYDAFLHYKEISKNNSHILNSLTLVDSEFVLTTIHRPVNTDNSKNLATIISALKEISLETKVIFPLHPRTKSALQNHGIDTTGITICEPVSYFDMIQLLGQCKYVITDSGGLQKEAYFCDKSAFVIRSETEWTELLTHHYVQLCPPNKELILNIISQVQNTQKKENTSTLFGDGNSRHIITKTLLNE